MHTYYTVQDTPYRTQDYDGITSWRAAGTDRNLTDVHTQLHLTGR